MITTRVRSRNWRIDVANRFSKNISSPYQSQGYVSTSQGAAQLVQKEDFDRPRGHGPIEWIALPCISLSLSLSLSLVACLPSNITEQL